MRINGEYVMTLNAGANMEKVLHQGAMLFL